MANFGDYQGLIWRPGDTVQTLESPRSLQRVDRTGLGSNDEDANKGWTEKETDDNLLFKLSYG